MTVTANSEADILSRIIASNKAGLSVEAARSILALSFDPDDIDRMNELSSKAGEGMLSEDEEQQLNSYERVGHLLAILQSKARTSLNSDPSDAIES
jgi:hypothetical protein